MFKKESDQSVTGTNKPQIYQYTDAKKISLKNLTSIPEEQELTGKSKNTHKITDE